MSLQIPLFRAVKTCIPSLILLALFCFGASVAGQGLQFQRTHIDVGGVDNWAADAAVFVFTNISAQKIALLKHQAPANVRVSYPRRFILPGESDTIRAWYAPSEPGPFRTAFSILTSTSDKPLKLSFSGNVLSYDACPDPEIPGGIRSPERTVIVLDSLTLEPVRGARVSLLVNDRLRINGSTGRNGSFRQALKPGLYQAGLTAEGYDTLSTGFYLNLRQPRITFLLSPAHTEQLPAPIVEEVEVEEEEENEALLTLPDARSARLPESPQIINASGELNRELFASNNIVFLIDVSSSMRSQGKMDRLRSAMLQLLSHLRDIDNLTLITYSTRAETVFQGLPGTARDSIAGVVAALNGRGNTYGVTGLNMAYAIAQEEFIQGGNNQVILATDGEFNSPGFNDRQLEKMIKEKKGSGIILSVVGFGHQEAAVKRMAMMAGQGGGSYLDFRPGLRVEELLLNEIKMNSRKE